MQETQIRAVTRSRSFRSLSELCVVPLLANAAAFGSCLDPHSLRPDRTPPAVQVITPIDTLYDVDGDKLVDFQLWWNDSGSAVDYQQVKVRSLTGVNGPANGSDNLLSAWRVDRVDTAGIVFHETLDNLLHGGPNRVEITIPDKAGNVSFDTLDFSVPQGAFLKTISTGLGGSLPAEGLAICPDDQRVYMTANRNLAVFARDSLKVLRIIPDPYAADFLPEALCVMGDPVLYVTEGRLQRFDRANMTWLTEVDSSFGSVAIAQSKANSNLIYLGESIDGTIGIYDRVKGVRVGYLLPISQQPENVVDIAVLPGDLKLYATGYSSGGILVIDPVRDSVLRQIPVGGPEILPDLGRADAVTLSKDGKKLFAAIIEGVTRGLAEIDTQRDSVTRVLYLFNYYCINVALSPSESRAFVTTQDNGSPSENVLVDLNNWRVLQTFPRPRAPGAVRFDSDVVFDFSGKLVFVTHDLDLDVYLSRE